MSVNKQQELQNVQRMIWKKELKRLKNTRQYQPQQQTQQAQHHAHVPPPYLNLRKRALEIPTTSNTNSTTPRKRAASLSSVVLDGSSGLVPGSKFVIPLPRATPLPSPLPSPTPPTPTHASSMSTNVFSSVPNTPIPLHNTHTTLFTYQPTPTSTMNMHKKTPHGRDPVLDEQGQQFSRSLDQRLYGTPKTNNGDEQPNLSSSSTSSTSSSTTTSNNSSSSILTQHLESATIFVSVASYRDSECPKTVLDCLMKATYPHRVFIGVCQQNESQDVDALSLFTEEKATHKQLPIGKKLVDQVRMIRLTANDAKGPIYARSLIEQQLYKGETYYLIIDSHTVFTPNWDTECIRELSMCPSQKPVLTSIPPDYNILTRDVPVNIPPVYLAFRNYHHKIDKDTKKDISLGFSQTDPMYFKHVPPVPQPNILWAAGFSFSLGQMIEQVPYDPHLQYAFLGEEISMATRLYTHGFDFFAPTKNLVYHYTNREYRPKFWEQFYKLDGKIKVDNETRMLRKSIEAKSNERIRALLRGDKIEDSHLYGLGEERSLNDYQQYVGLNFEHQAFTNNAKLGLTPNATNDEKYYKLG